MIAVIDYGMGNLRSVHKAFEAVNAEAIVTRERRIIEEASHLVLPGVGAFADCMANLDRYGLIDPIRTAITQGKPFLGICLGMQVLFEKSEEFGVHNGIGIVPGRVVRFPFGQDDSRGPAPSERYPLKVPHMGWNSLTMKKVVPLLRGVDEGAYAYFVHSYHVVPRDPALASTVTEYGVPFVSSIWRDNVFACQFHPEKSQTVGLRIIENFARWH
jgi:imidazole glycerol-phosphate synthase subunit HisH